MSQAEIAVDVLQVVEAAEGKPGFIEGRRWRISATVGLVATAAAATVAERYNLISNLDAAPKELIQGLRHPLIGYTATWLVSLKSKTNRLLTTFASVTAADALAQGGYVMATDPDRNPAEVLAHDEIGETAKDYLCTLGGVVLYPAMRSLDRLRQSDLFEKNAA